MTFISYTLFILFFIIIIYYLSNDWEIIMEGTNEDEFKNISDAYQYLKKHDVCCKYKKFQHDVFVTETTAHLIVNKRDLEKANELLALKGSDPV